MAVCEAEPLGLGFPSPPPSLSPSSATDAAPLEALNGDLENLKVVEDKQEEKIDGWDQEISITEGNGSSDKDSEPPSKDSMGGEKFPFPLRPNEPDCPYFMKTGTCRYGWNCKFNHPPSKLRVKGKSKKLTESVQAVEENAKATSSEVHGQTESKKTVDEMKRGFLSESIGLVECKYYLTPGGCKFGNACRYSHPEKPEVALLELNFVGLPMRPGEKECPYFMRTGCCKYSTNCRFHHPDPIVVGGQDPPPRYQNGGLPQQHPSPAQLPMTSWPLQRTANEPVTFLDAPPSYVPGIFLPPQGLHPTPEWNGYQASVNPLFPPDMSMQQPPPVSTMKDGPRKANGPVPKNMPAGDYPERPGQPECQYFMKTGSCKFKSACRFHHPKSRLPKTSGITVSPMGLPLRPDQPLCTHYSRHKTCKYGRSCKFNHPMDCGASSPPITENGPEQEINIEGSNTAPVQDSEW